MLNDGTSGLRSIRHCGGIAVAQDPGDADYDSMPRNALAHVDVDHTVRSQDLAPLLIDLVSKSARRRLEVEAAIKERVGKDPHVRPSGT